jgi:hypothetical protein
MTSTDKQGVSEPTEAPPPPDGDAFDYWRSRAEMLEGKAQNKAPCEQVTLMAGTLAELAWSIREMLEARRG